MTSVTINAQLPAPAPVQKRKVLAFGLIHYKTTALQAEETRPAEDLRVMGLMMVEDQTMRSSDADQEG